MMIVFLYLSYFQTCEQSQFLYFIMIFSSKVKVILVDCISHYKLIFIG